MRSFAFTCMFQKCCHILSFCGVRILRPVWGFLFSTFLQLCLGEQVEPLRERNSRPLSGNQSKSSSSSTCIHPTLHQVEPICIPQLQPLNPRPTCILCTNWIAEQSPSFCISQFGKASRFWLLLPFLGSFDTFAKFRGWWLPYHLQTWSEKVKFCHENPQEGLDFQYPK